MTCRAALRSAAAAAAVVLPAGAVMAAAPQSSGFHDRTIEHWKAHPEQMRRFTHGAPDPGLAKLEADYVEWRTLNARITELWELDDFALHDEIYRLIDRSNALVRRLLKIPTGSPRGVLLKLALAVGAQDLDADLPEALVCNHPAEGWWPALLTDLRAMGARDVA